MKTITSKKAARLLPSLLPDDNKYTRGLCELVVGDPIYAGAGVLAVMAATRMGAGYV
ncbi:MAG: bifunctional ADP-dependent NAD(P)H-hydrate dehydratase/NAD(P)H-hydrate epimerase, partial [Coriobacteriia bacterium]